MTALPMCSKSLNPQVTLVDEFTLVRVCSDSTHKIQRFLENSCSKCQFALLLYHTNELSILSWDTIHHIKELSLASLLECVCIAHPIKPAFPNMHRPRIIQIRSSTPKPLSSHQHSKRTHIKVMISLFKSHVNKKERRSFKNITCVYKNNR